MASRNDNSGALFKNDYKKADSHPDYKGPCMVNGVELEMAAWLTEKNGRKYMSVKFGEPYKKEESQQRGATNDAPPRADNPPF